MNKRIMLTFFLLLMVFIYFGCGKDWDGGGSGPDTSHLAITLRYPALGAIDRTTKETISITFNNSIDITKFNPNNIFFCDEHTAGTNLASFEYSWFSNNKVLTIKTNGWMSAESGTNPPFRVLMVNRGAIEDIYGNKLVTEEQIADYRLAEEFWRWWPMIVGTTAEYLHEGVYTYEVWNINAGSFYENRGYTSSIEAFLKPGTVAKFIYNIKSNDQEIRGSLIPYNIMPFSTVESQLLLAPSVEADGSSWYEMITFNTPTIKQAVTVEGRVEELYDYSVTLGKFDRVKKVSLWTTPNKIDFDELYEIVLAYNIGPVYIYNKLTNMTSEAVRYARP